MPTSYWARTDNNSANNPALNLTGDPSVLITFVPSGTNGDILLDANAGAADPDTQVEIGGVTYDFIFEFSATLPTSGSKVPTQYYGSTIYVVTVIDYPSPGDTTRLTFLPDDQATEAEMEQFGNGSYQLDNIDTTGPGVICFAEGTLLATPDGECAVEDLKAGDHVSTVDEGPMPIVWISSSRHVWPGGSERELPIMIARGSLSDGRPKRDLIVSPQHKVLLDRRIAPDLQKRNVLAPAKGLTHLPGIRQMKGKRSVTYYHVMLERHAILLSEGLPSESFYPGPTALAMLSPTQRIALLGKLTAPSERYGPMARPCLSVRETRELALRLRQRIAMSAN